ncbi:MAG: leucine-rich repeat domain-containing protein [Candidatus Hermodarchaeota archaeon]
MNNSHDFNELESIDEILFEMREPSEVSIPPEMEFWGHCSNLQVWYENNYNSRLLDRNLSFPLLKKLNEVGDTQARIALKTEIMERVTDNRVGMFNWFLEEGYFRMFDEDELRSLFLNSIDYESIYLLEECLKNNFIMRIDTDYPNNVYVVENGKIIIIRIYLENNNDEILELPACIGQFSHLKVLELQQNSFNVLPTSICNLTSLEVLILSANNLKSLPSSIGSLKNLKELHLDYNNLKNLPDSIEDLEYLEYLDLSNNSIMVLPECIHSLKHLKFLSLVNNPITLDTKTLRRLHQRIDRFFI